MDMTWQGNGNDLVNDTEDEMDIKKKNRSSKLEYIYMNNTKKTVKNTKFRVSTWNVRTMLVVGKMLEVAQELERYKIQIAALQEVRWGGQGRVDRDKFSILYSGDESKDIRESHS